MLESSVVLDTTTDSITISLALLQGFHDVSPMEETLVLQLSCQSDFNADFIWGPFQVSAIIYKYKKSYVWSPNIAAF